MIVTEIDQELEREFACECKERALRFRVNSRGVRMHAYQCLRCGSLSEWVKRDSVPYHLIHHAEPVDDGLQEAWSSARWQARRAKIEGAREAESREWFAGYSEYLASEKWARKRARVLERDGGLCQACLSRPATEVHHLTYEHVFQEPLFELISICPACHIDLTALDREPRSSRRLGR